MGAPAREKQDLITSNQLAALGEMGPCELVEGRIVALTPTGRQHALCEVNIATRLKLFAAETGLGRVLAGEVGILTGRDPDTVRGADVAFISNQRFDELDPGLGYLDVAPELVVEILSPSDRWQQTTEKLREYFAIGVRLIWLVDPEGRRAYVYRSTTDVREVASDGNLSGEDVLPGFSVSLAELVEP